MKGAKTGKGMLKFIDGSYYIGDFLNNEIHGKGKHALSYRIVHMVR